MDHFVDVNKMIEIERGSKRKVVDNMLNRCACYLVAENGNTKKENIASAHSNFANQTSENYWRYGFV